MAYKRHYPEEMIHWAIVQSAEDIGPDYTRDEYDEWRESTPDPEVVPASSTLVRRYGSWSNMKEQSGLADVDESDFFGPNLLLKLKQQ